MKRIIEDSKLLCEHYNSIHEFITTNEHRDLLSDAFRDTTKDKTIKQYIENHGESWFGKDVTCFKDAENLLAHGCDKISKSLKAKTNKGITSTTTKSTFNSSIVGCTPIVPLAIKGVPNSMLKRTQKPIKQKVIKILYDISHNCGAKAHDIEEQGAKTVKAIKDLERAGYRVELDVIEYVEQAPVDQSFTINIKKASQPLDLKRISFPLVHTSMLRIFGFIWYERIPGGSVDFGYGRPLSNRSYYDVCKTLKERGLLDENTVYINDSTDIKRALIDKYVERR